MRGEVISPFRDKFHFNTIYEVGAVLDFDEERMNSLIERKLCKMLEVQDDNHSAPLKDDKEIKDTPKKEVLNDGKENPVKEEEKKPEETPKKEVLKEKKESKPKKEKKESKPKKEKTPKKDAAESTEETSEKENVEEELDEKAKSEQEAAKKIAEAMSQAQK